MIRPFDESSVEADADGVRRYTRLPASVVALLRSTVEDRPDHEAVVELDGPRVSYRRLWDGAARVAGGLRTLGVERGDRVAIRHGNGLDWVLGFFGTLMAGGVVVPVNTRLAESEVDYILGDCTPKVVLAPGTPLPDAAPYVVDDLTRTELAGIFYTSGTTGFPKGCMHPHRTVMHNIVGGSMWSSSTKEGVSLSIIPLFHVTGMQYGMNAPIYMGSTVVMLPRWDREVAGRLISRYKITHWTNIPTMVIDFLASPQLAEFDLSSLAYIGGGGAAMPQAVAERLLKDFNLAYQEGYGLSETIAPTHSNPADRAKQQCLGIPVFNTDARIVDPQTLQELPIGEVGEIIVSGPQVFLGYWGKPQASAEVFIEFEGKRFFRTGDLGRMDEDGYFFLTDRLKRMINASGFKVWPAEVESLLYKHPDVQEACIIGTRDAYRGESVKAVVVLKAHAKGKTTEDDIINWARDNMAAYKYPRVVEFVDALPKSGTGKVMWRTLQEQENARNEAAEKPAAA